jgi:hypothetical protein
MGAVSALAQELGKVKNYFRFATCLGHFGPIKIIIDFALALTVH